MEIHIVRINSKSWGIEGHLYINRHLICDTVEHPTKHLPGGEYMIAPLPITGNPSSISPPFRHGDGALSALHGEIIVGKRLMSGVVTASQATYDRLYERLKKAFQRSTPVHLTIRG